MAPSSTFDAPAYTKTVHRSSYPAIDPSRPSNSAAGKVVVITGGGIGIGKSTAKAFVAAGAKAVAILGRRANILAEAKKELEAAGSTKIITHITDVLDQVAVEKAFASIAQEAGPIDVVVGNVGYLSSPEEAATADLEEYFRSFDINIRGTLQTFRAFVPHKSSNNPVFLSLNTAIAHARVIPGFSAYAASKAGQAVLVSHLQAENPDIRIVSFHPGVLETEMLQKSGLTIDRDDISLPASFAVWLASPAADWTGGRFLWSHWDVDELVQLKDQIVENDHLRLNLNGWPQIAQPTLV